MVQPLGSASTYGAVVPSAPPGWLEAQLTRAEQQLGACLSCDTAGTSQGQAQIRELTRRIQSLKAQLDGTRMAPPPRVPAPARVTEPEVASPGSSSQVDLSI